MSRYGLFCFLGRGHLDPALAIGRALRARGHEVTVLHLAIAEAAVRRAGLSFAPLDRQEPAGPEPAMPACQPRRPWGPTIHAVMAHAARTLREGPGALREARIDAIVADQLDVAAGTVAESLGLPFISLSCAPPLYLDDSVPAPYFGWAAAASGEAFARNRRGNALVERLASPVLACVNATRRRWRLPLLARVNQLFSTRGIITQLPAILELPRVTPPHLFYTGQFRDGSGDTDVRFDWQRLDGRPLVYASMGTVRNNSPLMFRMMAEAGARLDVQLVISLGGGGLRPADLGVLPDHPIVVHYAPQRALLDRAVLTINCGGLNTTLDALGRGVPIVALPVAEDQPGVGARIARAGVGIVEPAATITTTRLREAIVATLGESPYRAAAARLQRALSTINGVDEATTLIERLTGDDHDCVLSHSKNSGD